jgi:hypothetical protein
MRKNNPISHTMSANLFLGCIGLGLLRRPLLSGTLVSLIGPGQAQSRIRTALDRFRHVALLDLLDGPVQRHNREDARRLGHSLGLAEVDRVVALLGLVGLAGEEDQSLLVCL